MWAALFIGGLLGIWSGSPLGKLGVLIVAPTILCLLLFAWGYLIWQVMRLCGGDPKADAVGIWIFVSFAFFVLPLLIALARHGHWTRAFGLG